MVEAGELDRLGPMWKALYELQAEQGMLLAVPPDGFDLWRGSLEGVLGRFAAVFAAAIDGEPVGFVACRVRGVPAYFGGGLAGFISEVFVAEAFRRRGVARRLIDAAVAWCAEQGISRVELQVMRENHDAQEAYKKLGWVAELTQMVWRVRRPE